MKTLIALIVAALLASCKSYTTYTEVFDVDGKIVSKTVTIEADKLKEKGVAFGGSVAAAQIETDIAMSGGNPMPLPRAKFGFFTFFWIDAPIESGGIYFNQEKSLWSGNVASTTYVRFGSTQKGGRITLTSEPDMVLDLPFISIANPMTPNKVKMVVTPSPTPAAGAK